MLQLFFKSSFPGAIPAARHCRLRKSPSYAITAQHGQCFSHSAHRYLNLVHHVLADAGSDAEVTLVGCLSDRYSEISIKLDRRKSGSAKGPCHRSRVQRCANCFRAQNISCLVHDTKGCVAEDGAPQLDIDGYCPH